MPYVKSVEFLKKYPMIWNDDNWDDYIECTKGKYKFTIPFDLDPSHLDLDYEHGKCPSELETFISGSFFIDYITEFTEPFEVEFSTMFDATELYFYKWDGNELSKAVIDYLSRYEDLILEGRSKMTRDERKDEYAIFNDMLENNSMDERFRPSENDWEIIYKGSVQKRSMKQKSSTKFKMGTDIDAKDKDGKSALLIADKEGEPETAECHKKHSQQRNSEDPPIRWKTEGGFAIPKNYDHFHYIACIFKIFADKVGESRSSNVIEKMTVLLQEWLPVDKDARQIFKMIQPKLNELYNHDLGMLAFFLKTATQEIMETGIFKESNLRSIVLDLVDVAEADGEITENEAKFINRIAQYFGIEFSMEGKAKRGKGAKREEGSLKAGVQKDSDKEDIELVPKGKRVTYSDWSEFEKAQGEKNEQKKNNLPIAKKIHNLMFDVFSEKNKIFEIRYGDGTFSLSIPKDKAKSGKRTFARVGLLSLADKCVYLDTLYRVTGTAIPPGSFTWKKNDDSQFLFRIKTIEDFEKVRNSIKQSVIGSYNCLAKTKIT